MSGERSRGRQDRSSRVPPRGERWRAPSAQRRSSALRTEACILSAVAPPAMNGVASPGSPKLRLVSNGAPSRSSAGSVRVFQTLAGGCRSSRTKTSVHRSPSDWVALAATDLSTRTPGWSSRIQATGGVLVLVWRLRSYSTRPGSSAWRGRLLTPHFRTPLSGALAATWTSHQQRIARQPASHSFNGADRAVIGALRYGEGNAHASNG
jgi:hypothetical protein